MSTIVTASFLDNLALSSSTVIRSISGGFVWSGLACEGSWAPAPPTPAIAAPILSDKNNAQTFTAHFLKLICSSATFLVEKHGKSLLHSPQLTWTFPSTV